MGLTWGLLKSHLVRDLFSFDSSKHLEVVKSLLKYDNLIESYLNEISFLTLFQIYGYDNNILKSIVRKSFNEQNPIYIKEKKLCIIENGKEIKIENDINEDNIYELVKIFCKGIGEKDERFTIPMF